MKQKILKISCLFMFFTAFFVLNLTYIYSQSPNETEIAARNALQRLDEFLSGNNSGISSIPELPVQVTQGGIQPSWVDAPFSAYNRNRYIAAVGHGSSRAEAERQALLELLGIFGQSIRGDSIFHNIYSEAVSKGIVTVTQNTFMQDVIITSTSLDILIGAQIGNIWDSGRGMVYALAYMDREKTISIYTDLILLNNLSIEQLTAMNAAQKNTFDGYARFKLAETIANINAKYATVVSVSGGSTASLNIKSANSLNLDAEEILRNITVVVNVKNDQANRIRDAFAQVLTAESLRTGGNDPPYTLEVDLDLSEVTYPNNRRIYCRYVVSANLIENATGAVLLPFNFSGREGHSTYANAVTTAITEAEKGILEKYPIILSEYLAGIFPRE